MTAHTHYTAIVAIAHGQSVWVRGVGRGTKIGEGEGRDAATITHTNDDGGCWRRWVWVRRNHDTSFMYVWSDYEKLREAQF